EFDLHRLIDGQPPSVGATSSFARLLRWFRRGEGAEQAKVQTKLYLFLAGLHLLWAAMPPMADGVSRPRVASYMAMWTVIMVLMAGLNHQVTKKNIGASWLALVSSAALSTFTAAVLLDLVSYNAAGALRDPLAKRLLFFLYTLLALWSVEMNLTAL